MLSSKKDARGGRREGAGRKPQGDSPKVMVSGRISREAREMLDILTDQLNLPIGQTLEYSIRIAYKDINGHTL